MKINLHNLKQIFPDAAAQQFWVSTLNRLSKDFPVEMASENGYELRCFSEGGRGASLPSQPGPFFERDGTTRLMVYVTPGKKITYEPSDISLRLDIPLAFLTGSKKMGAYTLYHIRFAIPEGESQLDEKGCEPLFHGYIGITKRPALLRYSEHYKKVRAGEGHLLHKVWRSLLDEKISFYPCLQISGSAGTLAEIYALEEKMVGEMSLAPIGLNAIPGGEAGIRMLHTLSLLLSKPGNKLPGVAERDTAIEALERSDCKKGPCAHYRKGHMRRLAASRLTFVKPCWVKLGAAAA